MKILHLTLKKLPFEVTVTGEKLIEYRKPSKWIVSRLNDKDYETIRFTNGYGKTRPSVEVIFKHVEISTDTYTVEYSNGLTVNVCPGDILIHFSRYEDLPL